MEGWVRCVVEGRLDEVCGGGKVGGRCVVEGRLGEVCGGWRVGGRCVVEGRLGEDVWWIKNLGLESLNGWGEEEGSKGEVE